MINITFIIAGHTKDAPAPEIYVEAARRFADTYKKFPAGSAHRLFLINSNGGYTPQIEGFFTGIDYDVIPYFGSGWDIGGHLHAAYGMAPDDSIMCFSSWAHFRREGWLRAFVEARELNGEGIFGSTSSFQRYPHIRGTGFFIRCRLLQEYPYGCNSRDQSFDFEAGPESISLWCLLRGLGAWVVTPEKTVHLKESRTLDNIFRRGDQSNIWTFDKHTDQFEIADEATKAMFASWTDHHTSSAEFQRWFQDEA